MKLILLSMLMLFAVQDDKLQGEYRIEFAKQDGTQSFILRLDGDRYTKVNPDASQVTGSIRYSKYTATLKNDKDHPIEIDRSGTGKDTLKFNLKHKNNSAMKLNSGLLIRVAK
jgi:hypothetical protein